MVGLDYGKHDRARMLPYQARLLAESGITYPVTYGCASVSLAFVASGKLHAYVALGLEPWDMAAAVVIIREAGGRVTTVDGKEWELGDRSVLAANPYLHKKLLKLLS
jgi:myo-inositol-1(or 4)-monophosphatase